MTDLNQTEDINYEDELLSFIEDGGTMGMLRNVPDDAIEQMYAVAFNYFESAKYDQAHKIFQLLCTLDHYQVRFFMGLGACRQELQQYEQAVDAYSFVTLIDVNEPRAPFHAAECHLSLGNMEAAESGFYTANHLAKTQPAYSALALRASAMLEEITKQGVT
ncbi:SycD/LcrH family type III secretion system chaperone [Shewanella sp. VB17]|uniref:SycD/LcrH family type III secretion system chaperone n=1 Tax=Shewanella sp. VB17 TaxID=2739432 RepID=UPI001C25390C|nr:SycD/LcrH family type III secretion system chaperone [Shewanella sp. VB17]